MSIATSVTFIGLIMLAMNEALSPNKECGEIKWQSFEQLGSVAVPLGLLTKFYTIAFTC